MDLQNHTPTPIPKTPEELAQALMDHGFGKGGKHGTKTKAKLLAYARLYMECGVTNISEATHLTGAVRATIIRWAKTTDLIMQGKADFAPPADANIQTFTAKSEAGGAMSHASNSHELMKGPGPEAAAIRTQIKAVVMDRFNSGDPMSATDVKALTDTLSKIVSGLEVPKQSIQVQVLVGAEGSENASKELTENIRWLASRNELPQDLEDFLREKYSQPAPKEELAHVIPDADPNGHGPP